ncbi:MAG: hypothetical protein AABW90_00195 [Nanoarchaeota archaeon]
MANLRDYIRKIPKNSSLEKAIYYLENNRFDEARNLLEKLLFEKDDTVKSFVNYSLGITYIKKLNKGDYDVDKSIDYFEKSNSFLDNADAHLMVGYALQIKIANITKENNKDNYKNIIELADKSILEFGKASELNIGYKQYSKEAIGNLKRLKKTLDNMIQKRIVESN